MTLPLKDWLKDRFSAVIMDTKNVLNPHRTVPFDQVMENPEHYAIEFAEGNESLEKLLRKCFENNIDTYACCAGHQPNKLPYIGVRPTTLESRDFIRDMKHYAGKSNMGSVVFEAQQGPILYTTIPAREKVFANLADFLPDTKVHKNLEISPVKDKGITVPRTKNAALNDHHNNR